MAGRTFDHLPIRSRPIVMATRTSTAPYEQGHCRWCGEPLSNPDGKPLRNRGYCYPDREGRNCIGAVRASLCWSTRDALRRQARDAGLTALGCVDCGLVVEELVEETTSHGKTYRAWRPNEERWDADHDTAIEDGGQQTLENLRVRCKPCHIAKTSREATERAGRRHLVQVGQLELA